MRLPSALVLLLALAACSRPAPLAHTFESPEALATAVLEAYVSGNRSRLLDVALSEEEFRDHVWPELPAARPERNLPLSYVWGDLKQKSDNYLDTLLARHKGRAYALVSVASADRTPYQTYTVHRQSTVTVRDADGQVQELRLWGSTIEQNGRWKVFSYVVND